MGLCPKFFQMKKSIISVMDVINDIENEFPIDQLQYHGVNWWPVLRSEIGVLARNGRVLQKVDFEPENQLLKKIKLIIKLPFKTIQTFNELFSWRKIVKKKGGKYEAPKKLDFITLSSYKHRTDLFEDFNYNRYTDPIHFFLKPYSGLNIELLSPNLKFDKYPNSTCFYRQILIRCRLLNDISQIVKFENNNQLKEADKVFIDLCKHVNAKFNLNIIDLVSIKSKINEIEMYHKFFFKLFSKLKPRIVFLSSYYSGIFFGAIKAAKDFKIKIYDYQHGIQGDYHFAYSNWINFPKNGAVFMPDFLVYNQDDKLALDKQFNTSNLPKTFVVGNLWNKLWSLKSNSLFRLDNSSDKINILFCLSPIAPFFSDFLLKFMKGSNDLFWHIRLHPRYMNQKDEVVSILSKNEIINYEIDKSSTYNLQDLIVNSDIHITNFSSTCLDALDLGKKSIIVDQQGKLLYKKQIENGDFYYCNNELDLNKTVRNQVFKIEIDIPDAIDLKTLFN